MRNIFRTPLCSSALPAPRRVLPLFFSCCLMAACGGDGGGLGGSSDPVYQDMKGRTLTWDGGTLTLDNKGTLSDPVKRVVVLTGVGSRPSKGEVQVVTDARLNKISNKVHKCSGHMEIEGETLKLGISGSSDRCKMFSGQWYLKGGTTLPQMQQATQATNSIPSQFTGKFRGKESKTVKISQDTIKGTAPKATSAQDRAITLTLSSVEKTGDAYQIQGDLNTLGRTGKQCRGTISKTGSNIILSLTGNSTRCGLLSGDYK